MVKIRKHDDGFDLGHSDFVTKSPLDKDKLYLMPRGTLADAAHLALFQLQGMSAEEIVGGVSVLFAALSMRSGMDPEDMYQMGKKVITSPMNFEKTSSNSLEALRDFIGGRVMGQEVTIG